MHPCASPGSRASPLRALCAPHREDQVEGAPWTEPDGGDPAHLPDHRLRDGLGTSWHLDTLLPLLPPRISQNIVLIRAQLEGVRDLHGCYQIRPKNLHQKKKTILSAEVLQRLGAHVPRKGVLGKLPPRAVQRVSASPVVWLWGVTSGPFRVRFGQGNTATGRDSPPATQCQEPKPCSCNLSKVPHTGQSGNPATGCELGQDADRKLVLN